MKTSKPKSSLRLHAHAQYHRSIEMQCVVSLNQRKRICSLSMMLHELKCAEEAARMRRMVMARSRMRARRIESVQGGRNWDDDELAQCLSRPLGGVIPFVMVCIQSGHIFILSPWRFCKQRAALPTKAVSPKY
jgi:hypothetical protein